MVTGAILKVIEGFHHRVARWIAVKTAWSNVDREWECPPVEYALEISGLWPIKDYIQRRQATITAHISCRTIYELCTGLERMTGSS